MQIIHEELISTDPVPYLSRNGVNVFVLRTDKIHSVISGNKWFKLKLYIAEAQQQSKKNIVTFGGAYSNHIVATAAACNKYGLKSIGVIRGEEPTNLSHTLTDAKKYGMHLQFISRSDYRNKTLPLEFQSVENYIIPEGGYGMHGAAGAATIDYEKEKFDTVCCAVGTGTMMAGLLNAKAPHTQIIGFSVLKNHFGLEAEVRRLLLKSGEAVNIIHDFHFGGYAKYNGELIDFMNHFYSQSGIPTDFVYTAKLFYGVNKLIDSNYFEKSKNILVIHCGGLQGNLSLRIGTLIF